MIAGGMSQGIVMRAYASGGEVWSLKELWNYKSLKRSDPEAARALKAEKTSQAKSWYEANHSGKAKVLDTERKTATDEQIVEVEYLTALMCGGMDDFGEKALIHGKLDLNSETARVYGRAWKQSQGPENAQANHQPRRYKLQTVDDLCAMPPPRFRVKDVLPREGIAAIYGPSTGGKSFLGLDLIFAISDGKDFFGYRVEPCDVLYVCLEGQSGLSKRVRAYRKRHGVDAGKRVHVITVPFSLLYSDDIDALVATVKDAGIRDGVIMIDTLNAASAGADENTSADMGRILEAIRRILEECGGSVILVHHSGKDASKGMRGHSSLFASMDAVIEVTRDGDLRSWKLAKSKDGLDGKEHPFRLSVVEVDTDNDDNPVISCVIEPEERAADSVRRVKIPASGNQKIVYEVIGECLRASKDYDKGGAPAGRPCVRTERVIEACQGRLSVEGRRVTERARAAITGLVNKGCIMLRDGWIWDA